MPTRCRCRMKSKTDSQDPKCSQSSTYILVTGICQLKKEDCMKTAFCPGPGMVLYEFCRMSSGVTGGPSSFQRLMDNVTFVWTEECQKAFQKWKDLLSQAPVLCYPSLTKDFELQTDASAVGLGAVLEQDGHVLAYASRSLTHAERQYNVLEREFLAVLHAVKQFRYYLHGRAFALHADHQPLQWLSAQKMEGTVTVPEFYLEHVAQEQGKDKCYTKLSTEGRKGPEWCTLTECDAEKESTLSREGEWEPASIKHFSVPTDSTPQPEIVHEIPPAVPLPNEQFLDNYADVPQAVQPPIDIAGQAAPPTLDQAQRRYPQRERRPPNYYQVQIISSGVQQGYPLDPLQFSLVLHAGDDIQPACMMMECVDCLDGTHPAKLCALHLGKELSPAMGLHVNMAKCELFSLKGPQCGYKHCTTSVLSSEYCI
ncbi:hypothetical protein EMCRGX_G007952 [Ephydatia muelleri]